MSINLEDRNEFFNHSIHPMTAPIVIKKEFTANPIPSSSTGFATFVTDYFTVNTLSKISQETDHFVLGGKLIENHFGGKK